MATLSKNTSLVNGQPKERNKLRILVAQVAHNKGINFWNAAPVAADDDQRRFAGAAIICITVIKSGQNHVIGGQVSVVSLPFVILAGVARRINFTYMHFGSTCGHFWFS